MQFEQPPRLGTHGSVGSRVKDIAFRASTMIAGVVALAGALVFSLAFFVALLAVLLVFGSYFWWKTRDLRKQVREQMEQQSRAPATPRGEIIEGVVISREER